MRKELGKRYNQRDRFYGNFEKFGSSRNYKTGEIETTILLVNIRNRTGKILTDHLWFKLTKGFQKVNDKGGLKKGTLLRFEARVKGYTKGYEKDLFDYKLNNPSNIVVCRTLKFKEN